MSLTDLVVPLTPLAPAAPEAVPAPTPSPLPATPSPLSATPLPLPAGTWGAEHALAAVGEAADLLPLALPEPSVVSALTTVVLRAGGYAVKVYPPGTDAAHLAQVGTALAGSHTAHLPAGPPLVTPHGVLTLTPWLPATGGVVSWPQTGALLRAFHDEHALADVPRWTPLSRLPSQAALLPEGQASVLLEARTTLLAALGEVRSELGEGVIHGDVSPSNVMQTPDGPRLIDLDWVAVAPREYDLASASRRFRAGEMSREEYAGFCTAYGFDVLSWPGLPVLDRIAELGGVAFRLWDCRHHGRPLDWVADELRRWRTPL